ncbi:MAG TPA: hypothetical protein VND45_14715 [Thermoanaerobaculia bacterium]|jgi:hypothetical protein|nr:hypothetical protein [Thermoanaerobaculia bacterium]
MDWKEVRMKSGTFMLLLVVFAIAWTEPAAAVAYCPPEYNSCDGAGTPGGTWRGGDPTATRDGIRQHGTPYSQCVTGPNMVARCWECGWNPDKRTETCFGVLHTASCACYERYSNYIVSECWTSGSCEYRE